MQHNDKHGHFTSEDAISSGEIGGTTYEARNRTTGSTAPSFNSFYDGIRPWGARKGSPRHSFWTLVALALSAFAVFFHLLVPFGEVFLAKGGWNLRGHGCTKKGQHDAYTVTFDNYSLIIGGQRVFLQYVRHDERAACEVNGLAAPEKSTHLDSQYRRYGLTYWRKPKQEG